MTPEESTVYSWEGGLIIQIDKIAEITKTLTKQLVAGRVSSEVRGAAADLRNIANALDRLSTAT